MNPFEAMTDLGRWVPIEAPGDLGCWQLDRGDPDTEPPVYLVVPPGESLADIDAPATAAVLAELPGRLADARRAVAAAVAADPVGFGAERPDTDAEADLPELVFYPGRQWMIRFAVTALPGCGELGVAVEFTGDEVTAVVNLAGSQEL